MFCNNCGAKISDNGKFCLNCGEKVLGKEGPKKIFVNNSSLIGYSPKINHSSFDKYKKDSKSYSFIFASILAVIAIVAFPIYGKSSGDIEWPFSLYYGMGIGGMFLLIALFQTISRSTDITWDGVIVDKKHYEKTKRDRYSDSYSKHIEFEYSVRRENGKIYKHSTEDDDTVYNYYNIGDKVRHHKGFGGYEKYDKSKDEILFCTACGTLNEITKDVCFRCKCPLLK